VISVAVGPDGTIFALEGCRVRAVHDGAVRTIVGDQCLLKPNTSLDQASLRDPREIAVAPDGALHVVDFDLVRRIHDGRIDTVAGGGQDRGDVEKPALSAAFVRPWGIAFGRDGALLVADTHRVFEVHDGIARALAGGAEGFSDGPAPLAALSAIGGVAFAQDGAVYVGDTENHRVRVVRDGVVTTFAGDGEACSRDGPSPKASFAKIHGIAVDPKGRVIVLDANRVRVIDGGRVTTLAGD
jgi:DNA-binding beta-propeller fold protein YncE